MKNDWGITGVSTTKEVTIFNQPRGKELENRVCGLNPAGQGDVSNLIVAVL